MLGGPQAVPEWQFYTLIGGTTDEVNRVKAPGGDWGQPNTPIQVLEFVGRHG